MKIFLSEHPELEDMDKQSIEHLIKLYDQNANLKIESNSMNSIVQGVFILFVTWLFFNASSGFTIVHRNH
jgi:ammonia channel protein AmtB